MDPLEDDSFPVYDDDETVGLEAQQAVLEQEERGQGQGPAASRARWSASPSPGAIDIDDELPPQSQYHRPPHRQPSDDDAPVFSSNAFLRGGDDGWQEELQQLQQQDEGFAEFKHAPAPSASPPLRIVRRSSPSPSPPPRARASSSSSAYSSSPPASFGAQSAAASAPAASLLSHPHMQTLVSSARLSYSYASSTLDATMEAGGRVGSDFMQHVVPVLLATARTTAVLSAETLSASVVPSVSAAVASTYDAVSGTIMPSLLQQAKGVQRWLQQRVQLTPMRPVHIAPLRTPELGSGSGTPGEDLESYINYIEAALKAQEAEEEAAAEAQRRQQEKADGDAGPAAAAPSTPSDASASFLSGQPVLLFDNFFSVLTEREKTKLQLFLADMKRIRKQLAQKKSQEEREEQERAQRQQQQQQEQERRAHEQGGASSQAPSVNHRASASPTLAPQPFLQHSHFHQPHLDHPSSSQLQHPPLPAFPSPSMQPLPYPSHPPHAHDPHSNRSERKEHLSHFAPPASYDDSRAVRHTHFPAAQQQDLAPAPRISQHQSPSMHPSLQSQQPSHFSAQPAFDPESLDAVLSMHPSLLPLLPHQAPSPMLDADAHAPPHFPLPPTQQTRRQHSRTQSPQLASHTPPTRSHASPAAAPDASPSIAPAHGLSPSLDPTAPMPPLLDLLSSGTLYAPHPSQDFSSRAPFVDAAESQTHQTEVSAASSVPESPPYSADWDAPSSAAEPAVAVADDSPPPSMPASPRLPVSSPSSSPPPPPAAPLDDADSEQRAFSSSATSDEQDEEQHEEQVQEQRDALADLQLERKEEEVERGYEDEIEEELSAPALVEDASENAPVDADQSYFAAVAAVSASNPAAFPFSLTPSPQPPLVAEEHDATVPASAFAAEPDAYAPSSLSASASTSVSSGSSYSSADAREEGLYAAAPAAAAAAPAPAAASLVVDVKPVKLLRRKSSKGSKSKIAITPLP